MAIKQEIEHYSISSYKLALKALIDVGRTATPAEYAKMSEMMEIFRKDLSDVAGIKTLDPVPPQK